MAQRRCSVRWLNEAILAAQGEEALPFFYRYIGQLLRYQMLGICAGSEERDPLATLIPISPAFQPQWVHIQDGQSYRMSRFAYTRRNEINTTVMESPLAHGQLRLEHAITAKIIYQLGEAQTAQTLAEMLPETDPDDIASIMTLLLMGNFMSPSSDNEQAAEAEDETLMQWEFHDLLFHSRSRQGRHNNIVGGTYRFKQILAPQPAIKQPPWPITVKLPTPDMDQLQRQDPGLFEVMEARSSLRAYGSRDLTIEQIGEFLYRVARIKTHQEDEESGGFTTRPYPSAGASYEMEFYLTINGCQGLEPGFYWYDPLQHALALIQTIDKGNAYLLNHAQQITGATNPHQLVITLAARFQRVSWKYQGIAYQLILKDVGVLFATMYLVATAMKLAPCALGYGDSDHFAQLAGTNYLQETSVGEFALGSQPDEMV
ncbi:dehydrogenase [Dictyobacter vulcani]|uniref:Dehydrogenase n=1 Tax=Dictyobacter vulcani TaxID=2607529 RepID=A0A5J4KUD2_9CHLR|nr:SagB family peptide dehydrogenase [Dictyobacter vulcani]GER91515.1 dehydrogenase [Dictyobacter vulcani]